MLKAQLICLYSAVCIAVVDQGGLFLLQVNSSLRIQPHPAFRKSFGRNISKYHVLLVSSIFNAGSLSAWCLIETWSELLCLVFDSF